MSGFSRFFIGRPRLALVVACLLALLGVGAFALLPVRLYPCVAPTKVTVSCTYPGANSREVMNTVAGPIENQVNGVENMLYMSSSCADSGAYSLTICFELGTDRDFAMMKVQNRVQQAMSLLPQEVKNTGVTVGPGSTEHIGMVMLRSPGRKLSAREIADYAHGIVQPALLRVAGVGSASVSEQKVAMRVWLDPRKLSALGLTAADVVAAVKNQNVQASLGSIGASPTADASCQLLTLVAQGRLHEATEFDRIVVRTEADGSLVRLCDLGRTECGREAYATATYYNDEPATKITVTQLPGADIMRTMARLKAEMKGLERDFPADLTWEMSYDTTRLLFATLRTFAKYALGLFLLAVLCVGLVLRSLRAAFVLFVCLPLSLLPAYAALGVFGGSLGALSTLAGVLAFALALADATLVVGRTLRIRREEGLPAPEAAMRAMDGLASPLAVSILALLAVFVPFGFVSGFNGAVYRPFAVILSAGTLFSGFAALTAVPALAGAVLGSHVRQPAARRSVRSGFGPSALLLLVLAGVVAAVCVRLLPTTLIPDEDTGVLYLDCNAAEGTSLPLTAAVCRRASAAVRQLPAVDKVLTICGSSDIGGTGENQGIMQVILKDWSERRGPGQSLREMLATVVATNAAIPAARLCSYQDPTVPGLASMNGVHVLFCSTGDQDPIRLAREAHRLEAILTKSPLFDLAVCGYTADSPYLRLQVDREKCELLGVPVSSLYSTLQQNLGSVYVNDVNLGVQVNRVTLEADAAGRLSRESVEGLFVRSSSGEMVPVGSLVTFKEELGPRCCYRYNQYVYCSTTILPKKGVSTGEAIAECERIVRANIAPGFSYDWCGPTFFEMRTKGNGPVLCLLAVLLPYLILVGWYESSRRPLLALAPALFAVAGGLLLIVAAGGTLNLYSQMAILAVCGLAVKFGVLSEDGLSEPVSVRAVFVAYAVGLLPFVLAVGVGVNALHAVGLAALGATLGAWFGSRFLRA